MFRKGHYSEVMEASDGCSATGDYVTIKEKTVEYKKKKMRTDERQDLQDRALLYGITRKAIIRNYESKSRGGTDATEIRKYTGNLEVNGMSTGIVQYVVIRGDLTKTLEWPVGAVVAQACHACTAVTHLFYNDQHTRAYLDDLDNMRKVVLEAPGETDLRELHEKLDGDNIDHRLWIERPENIATCLVVKPYPKERVQKYFKKFKLFDR